MQQGTFVPTVVQRAGPPFHQFFYQNCEPVLGNEAEQSPIRAGASGPGDRAAVETTKLAQGLFTALLDDPPAR